MTQKLELDLRKENAQLKKWCEEFNALEVANENTKLKKENKKLCKKIDELYENIDMWAAENAKFRELLEECQGSIATLLSKKITEVNGIKQEELLAKISEALGEE